MRGFDIDPIERTTCLSKITNYGLLRTRDRMRSHGQIYRNSLSNEALLGVAIGIIAGLFDLAFAKPSSDMASGWLFAVFVLLFLALIGSVLLVALHFWWKLVVYIARPESGYGGFWLYWCCSTTPLIAFVWWVPWSWIEAHWEGLSLNARWLVVGIYFILAVGPVLAAATAYWIHNKSKARLWLNITLRCAYLALAGTCFYADRTLFPGLYRNFHFGLAGGVLVFLFAMWKVPVPDFLSNRMRSVRPSISFITGVLLILFVGILHTSVGRASADSGSLLFSKAMAIANKAGDIDGDGSSPFFGGNDCDPFDARVGPGRFDMPGNGIDEDCSGKDTKWPEPIPAGEKPWRFSKLPNIVLISIDALRADHVSAYGYKRRTTPAIDKLAREGMLFSNAFVQSPKTFNSIPSIMTGLYPYNLPRNYKHKRARKLNRPYSYYLTDEMPTLAERLKAKGYTTQAYVTFRILWTLGLDRGFDEFKVGGKKHRRIEDFIRAIENKPFFLWIHYIYPHHPYERRKAFDFGSEDIDRYDGEVARSDLAVGEVVRMIQERGLRDNTLFIVTADHGEEFNDHGGKYHGGKLYKELIHVPLILNGPQIAHRKVETPVELVDLVPTLVSALQLEADPNEFDGESLFRAVYGKRTSVGAYSEVYQREQEDVIVSLITPKWHYIYNLSDDHVELYDVKADPKEKRNVAMLYPEALSAIREASKSRTLRRDGIAFRRLEATGNLKSFIRNLWIFRREALLLAALDKIAEGDISEFDEQLADLAKRPLLQQSVLDRINELRGRGSE